MKRVVPVIICYLFISFGVHANNISPNERYEQAFAFYQSGEFDKALENYRALVAENYSSKDLYYNLGNCLAKKEEMAEAILYYERALKLAPFDRNIQHNLDLAEAKIGEEIIEIPAFFLLEYWNSFSSLMRANHWIILFFIFFVLSLFFIYKWLFGKLRKVKKRSFYLAAISFLITSLSFFTSMTSYNLEYGKDSAIIMTDAIYLKSGPDAKSNDMRLLNGGVKVEILDKIGNWYKVQLANNEIGWIEIKELEII